MKKKTGKVSKVNEIVILLFLIVVLCLFTAKQKSGMFIDEIYTMGLANSYYEPFLRVFYRIT